jgi:hypothetical protein
MPQMTRLIAGATFSAAALVAGAALVGLGTDRWIGAAFQPASDTRIEVWGSGLKPVLATEADWLAPRTATSRLQSTAATQIDLGPLDIIAVRPLPTDFDLGEGESNAPKLLVSAREPGTGRVIRVIVDQAPPQAGKQRGL